MAKNRACTLVVVFSLTAGSSALAQSRVWEGSDFPVFFGSQGERHYPKCGYYGLLEPPLASDLDEQTVASRPAPPPRATDRVVEYAAGYVLAAVPAATKTDCQAALARDREREGDLKLGKEGNRRRK